MCGSRRIVLRSATTPPPRIRRTVTAAPTAGHRAGRLGAGSSGHSSSKSCSRLTGDPATIARRWHSCRACREPHSDVDTSAPLRRTANPPNSRISVGSVAVDRDGAADGACLVTNCSTASSQTDVSPICAKWSMPSSSSMIAPGIAAAIARARSTGATRSPVRCTTSVGTSMWASIGRTSMSSFMSSSSRMSPGVADCRS